MRLDLTGLYLPLLENRVRSMLRSEPLRDKWAGMVLLAAIAEQVDPTIAQPHPVEHAA